MTFDPDRLPEAQRDMRHGYAEGSTGVFASGLAWLAAAVVAGRSDATHAVWTLYIAGLFIHPVGLLLAKAMGRPGAHARGNPLGMLALDSTILMILCVPATFFAARASFAWFFPSFLLLIGGRYFVFATVYGNRLFRVLGAVLAVVAWGAIALRIAPAACAAAGGLVELAFAAALFARVRRSARPAGAALVVSSER